MRKLPAALIATASALVSGVLTFPAAMWLSVATDRCDRSKHICDLAPIAGIGLGFLLAPVVMLGVGIVTYRRLRRPHRVAPAV